MSSSARRTLRILATIGGAERPLGVTEIGRQLGISAGTVFRGLDALERGGFVGRYQASSRYVVGPAVSRLRRSLFARFPIREICLPYLRQLAFASGETVSLMVPVGWYGLRLAAAPGTNEVTTAPSLGDVRPLGSAGATGKAILAFLPAPELARYHAWAERQGIERQAIHVATAAKLHSELDTVRQRGFAVEATAFASGRGSIALPVRRDGHAIAAVAVEGPVVDLRVRARHPELARWIDIVRTIEALARTRPALFENPFGHIDPEAIVLNGRTDAQHYSGKEGASLASS